MKQNELTEVIVYQSRWDGLLWAIASALSRTHYVNYPEIQEVIKTLRQMEDRT